MTHPTRISILTGPTATGKTELALKLALRHGAIEIINADSLLVYRGMCIGTAKPMRAELDRIPHHLIDIREPNEEFTAGDFVRSAHATIEEIHSRGKRALIVGGTGFYLKSLLYGLWAAPKAEPALREELRRLSGAELFSKLHEKDPQAAIRIGQNDHYRLVRALEIIELTGKTPTELEASQTKEPDPRFHLFVIDRPPEELAARIEARTRAMLENGLIEEVQALRSRYPQARALSSVGYAQVCAYLDGSGPQGRVVKPGWVGL